MRRLQQKRSIAKFLCFLMILEMFVVFPNVAEASVSKTISKNGREYCAVEGDKQTITVTLASPNKPENTKVVSSSVPGWASVSKPNYNSPVFKVTVQRNTGNGSRVQNIEFTDGTNTWTLTLTQYVYTPPTTTPKKPTTQPKKDNPTKSSTPTPKSTPVPTSTPTPLPALTTDVTALNFRADGETKSVTIGGYTGPLRADRGDTWFTVSVSGGIVSVTATKNTSTARTSYLDITDTGSGRSVRIQVNQAAPIYNPEPSKAPTKAPTNTPTPTPVPSETLPVSRKKVDFNCKAGQDTLSLDGKKYSLSFSFSNNTDPAHNWAGMIYDGSTIKVKVDRNTSYDSRSIRVKITDSYTNQYAYVTIKQGGVPMPDLSVNQTEISCDSKGGEKNVTLTGIVGSLGYTFAWETATESNWVKVRPEGNKVVFSIDESRSINPRTAVITITDSKSKKSVAVTINQEAMPNSTNVQMPVYVKRLMVHMPYTSVYNNRKHDEEIEVSGNSGMLQFFYEWDEKQTGWVQMVYTGNSIKLHVNESNSIYEREVKVRILDEASGQSVTVTIRQEAVDSTIPSPIVRTVVDLNFWALRTGKAIDYLRNWDFAKACDMAPNDLVELIMCILSVPNEPSNGSRVNNAKVIDSKEFELELEIGKGYMNGQKSGALANFVVGGTNFSNAGCGIIACYNALNHFDKAPKYGALLDFIECFEKNGYLMKLPVANDEVYRGILATLLVQQSWHPNDQRLKELKDLFVMIVKYKAYQYGGCGVNPYKVDDVLAKYGLKTKAFQTKSSFMNSVQNALKSKTHKCYIVDYWNQQGAGTGHFIFIETDEANGILHAYNWTGGKVAQNMSIQNLEDEIGNGKFILAYEVTK